MPFDSRVPGVSRSVARASVCCLLILAGAPFQTRVLAQQTDPSRITLDRMFGSPDFQQDELGPAHWLPGSTTGAYTLLEPAAGGAGRGVDIVRFDAVSGTRDVLVPASKLVPPGASDPIDIENYTWSPDGSRV